MDKETINQMFKKYFDQYQATGSFPEYLKELIVQTIQLNWERASYFARRRFNIVQTPEQFKDDIINDTYLVVVTNVENGKILKPGNVYTRNNGDFNYWLFTKLVNIIKKNCSNEKRIIVPFDKDNNENQLAYPNSNKTDLNNKNNIFINKNVDNLLYEYFITWIKFEKKKIEKLIDQAKRDKKPTKALKNKIVDLNETIGIISVIDIDELFGNSYENFLEAGAVKCLIGDGIGEIFSSFKKDCSHIDAIIKNLIYSAKKLMRSFDFNDNEIEEYLTFSINKILEAKKCVLENNKSRWDAKIQGNFRNHKHIVKRYLQELKRSVTQEEKQDVTKLIKNLINQMKSQE